MISALVDSLQSNVVSTPLHASHFLFPLMAAATLDTALYPIVVRMPEQYNWSCHCTLLSFPNLELDATDENSRSY